MTNTYNLDEDIFNLICNDIEDETLRTILSIASQRIDSTEYYLEFFDDEVDLYATFDDLVELKKETMLDIIYCIRSRKDEMHKYLINAYNNENTLMYSHNIDLNDLAEDYGFDTKEFVEALYTEELDKLEDLVLTGKKILA